MERSQQISIHPYVAGQFSMEVYQSLSVFQRFAIDAPAKHWPTVEVSDVPLTVLHKYWDLVWGLSPDTGARVLLEMHRRKLVSFLNTEASSQPHLGVAKVSSIPEVDLPQILGLPQSVLNKPTDAFDTLDLAPPSALIPHFVAAMAFGLTGQDGEPLRMEASAMSSQFGDGMTTDESMLLQDSITSDTLSRSNEELEEDLSQVIQKYKAMIRRLEEGAFRPEQGYFALGNKSGNDDGMRDGSIRSSNVFSASTRLYTGEAADPDPKLCITVRIYLDRIAASSPINSSSSSSSLCSDEAFRCYLHRCATKALPFHSSEAAAGSMKLAGSTKVRQPGEPSSTPQMVLMNELPLHGNWMTLSGRSLVPHVRWSGVPNAYGFLSIEHHVRQGSAAEVEFDDHKSWMKVCNALAPTLERRTVTILLWSSDLLSESLKLGAATAPASPQTLTSATGTKGFAASTRSNPNAVAEQTADEVTAVTSPKSEEASPNPAHRPSQSPTVLSPAPVAAAEDVTPAKADFDYLSFFAANSRAACHAVSLASTDDARKPRRSRRGSSISTELRDDLAPRAGDSTPPPPSALRSAEGTAVGEVELRLPASVSIHPSTVERGSKASSTPSKSKVSASTPLTGSPLVDPPKAEGVLATVVYQWWERFPTFDSVIRWAIAPEVLFAQNTANVRPDELLRYKMACTLLNHCVDLPLCQSSFESRLKETVEQILTLCDRSAKRIHKHQPGLEAIPTLLARLSFPSDPAEAKRQVQELRMLEKGILELQTLLPLYCEVSNQSQTERALSVDGKVVGYILQVMGAIAEWIDVPPLTLSLNPQYVTCVPAARGLIRNLHSYLRRNEGLQNVIREAFWKDLSFIDQEYRKLRREVNPIDPKQLLERSSRFVLTAAALETPDPDQHYGGGAPLSQLQSHIALAGLILGGALKSTIHGVTFRSLAVELSRIVGYSSPDAHSVPEDVAQYAVSVLRRLRTAEWLCTRRLQTHSSELAVEEERVHTVLNSWMRCEGIRVRQMTIPPSEMDGVLQRLLSQRSLPFSRDVAQDLSESVEEHSSVCVAFPELWCDGLNRLRTQVQRSAELCAAAGDVEGERRFQTFLDSASLLSVLCLPAAKGSPVVRQTVVDCTRHMEWRSSRREFAWLEAAYSTLLTIAQDQVDGPVEVDQPTTHRRDYWMEVSKLSRRVRDQLNVSSVPQ